ncbi:MAG: hypothetical protein IKT93_01140, partial [Clostridia bacterium]|nr:hypothetical protein [Clostridia bacterium]
MKQRNVGIDILRVISMFFIIVGHILAQGGGLTAYLNGGMNNSYHFFNILFILALCGVNCFALVSGYVGWQNTFKP